jgi:hypothetical protein
VVVCILAGLLAGQARGEETLALSRSLVAIKVTNPELQLIRFAPLLGMIDGLVPAGTPGAPNARASMTSVTAMLGDMVKSLTRLPGVDARGDLWVVIMPPAKAEEIPPLIDEDGVMKPNPALAPPVYLVLPLTDAKAFNTYYEKDKAATTLRYTVAGEYAVGHMTETPRFTGVEFDLPQLTTFDIALSFQIANIDLAPMGENMPPMLEPMVLPVIELVNEQRDNVLRVEMGLTMDARDLRVETFVIPVADSPLARSLEEPAPDTTAFDYAAYLPKDLAYCGASGPALVGAPGTAQFLLRMAFGILAGFLPEERGLALAESFNALMAQSTRGRAVGITVPADANAGAALVGVYRVTDEGEARKAMRAFVQELTRAGETVMGGMLSNIIRFDLKPEKETIEGLPVDCITVSMVQTDAPDGEKDEAPILPAPVPFNLECRVAYLGDKMLVTMGYASNQEMAALIKRIRQPGADGFTTGANYRTLKQNIAEKANGFESIALRDLSLVVTSWFPPDQRTNARKFITLFPPQGPPITTCQEMRPGYLYGAVCVPGGQLDFLYSAMKAAQTMWAPTTETEREE